MELNDTVDMMLSKDYKDRFKAEFHQLDIRCNKLRSMLKRWDSGELDFVPAAKRDIFGKQYEAMREYRNALAMRAHQEGIELNENRDPCG